MSLIKKTKGKPRRRRSSRSYPKKRIDINTEAIDYKNTELLKKFVTEKGRILPRRVTGMPTKLHRRVVREIKRARNVLLSK
jgi:small subunit ribosomal protein S18